MQLFYAPDISGNIYVFPQDESKHIVKVLRLKEGDSIHITDGKGNLFISEIVEADIKNCKVKVTSKRSEEGKRDFSVHIAIAPTKNIKRFEWFLEKCTEIGVDEITPLKCMYSERDHIRLDRLNRVVSSAMKQSLKTYLPVLNEMTDFEDFLSLGLDNETYRCIALCDDSPKQHLKNAYSQRKDVVIIIGPEGDFSDEEKESAKEKGFKPVSISSSRLRTETAGVVACHTVNLMNEEDV
ncbi:MAG: 16S rRNA (uracil(1498)-N(3))-methyltransferase [Bacteroidota bacterium]